MADKTAPIAQDPSRAEAPATDAAPETPGNHVPGTRRTVTVPVLPLAIIGAVVVALIFFGGGIAVGFAIGDHPSRVGVIQPFNGGQGGQNGYGQNNGRNGFGPNRNGTGNGFGQHRGQNGGQSGQGNGTPPSTGPTTAPNNG